MPPPLRSPKQVGRLGFYSPEEGAPPLRPRVTFPSRGKSPKARQGLRPLESPEGDRAKSETLFAPAPPAASRNPLDRVSTIKQDRFATLSLWANRSLFLPKLHRGSHLQLSIRGAAGGFSFCGRPGVAPFSGGSGNAAGGMIMPPKGSPRRGCPPSGRFFGDFLIGEES